MSTDLMKLPEGQQAVATKLKTSVLSVISNRQLEGFEKAFLIANATVELQGLLTPEIMKPIMALQGNRLGFLTDKDGKGGYELAVVKNCLIEAVLLGLQPHSNQFNIIAGNMYVTKEGFGHLLSQTKGLSYKVIPGLPRLNADKTSAAINVKLKWTFNGKAEEEDIELPIKVNAFMGVDAIAGKATRKARAWLFNTIHGTEVADGDAVDVSAEVMSSKVDRVEEKSTGLKDAVKGMMGKKEKAVPDGDPSRIPDEDKDK